MNSAKKGLPAVWMALCAVMTIVILSLALLPSAYVPAGLWWDKLNHAAAIAFATALAYLSLQPRVWASTAAFLYGTFLGILIELLQASLTTGRLAEWGDVAADMAGAGCIWVIIKLYHRRTAPKRC